MTVDTVKRLRLPSGGWWDIETRPRWRHVREWFSMNGAYQSESPAGTADGPDLADRALASLTVAWSFPEDVSVSSLPHRDPRDTLAALELLEAEVLPAWDRRCCKNMAEELFSALVAGRVPAEFAEAHVIASTGWSWQTLMDTPADVVEKLTLYLSVTHVREIGGVLDFPRGNDRD